MALTWLIITAIIVSFIALLIATICLWKLSTQQTRFRETMAPESDNIVDLGTPTLYWNNIYTNILTAGNIYISKPCYLQLPIPISGCMMPSSDFPSVVNGSYTRQFDEVDQNCYGSILLTENYKNGTEITPILHGVIKPGSLYAGSDEVSVNFLLTFLWTNSWEIVQYGNYTTSNITKIYDLSAESNELVDFNFDLITGPYNGTEMGSVDSTFMFNLKVVDITDDHGASVIGPTDDTVCFAAHELSLNINIDKIGLPAIIFT